MALSRLRDLATARFTGPLLALALVAGTSLNSAPAEAGGVGFQDVRDSSQEVIDRAPVHASNNRTAIIAYGGSNSVLNTVYEATGSVAAELDRDIIFITAPDNDSDSTDTLFKIYINGDPAWKFNVKEGGTSVAAIELTIKDKIQSDTTQLSLLSRNPEADPS